MPGTAPGRDIAAPGRWVFADAAPDAAAFFGVEEA